MRRIELTTILWLEIIVNNWLWSTNLHLAVKIAGVLISVCLLIWWIIRQLNITDRQSTVRLTLVLLTSWVLILPLGGLGITSYLLLVVPLPDKVLQMIYLHRLPIAVIVIIIYLVILIGWWLARSKIITWIGLNTTNHPVVEWRRSVTIWLVETALAALILTISFVDLKRQWGAGLMVTSGTFILANTCSWLLVRFLKVEQSFKPTYLVALAGLSTLVMIGLWVVNRPAYPAHAQPLIIAHRGVDGNNGVQNTMQSLKNSRHHVKYVEMDIQETADHQFVCLHDPNLEHLAHHRFLVKDHRLRFLTKLQLTDHGKQAELTSFDEYLAAAKRYHIQLVVEIKPQNGVSPQQATRQFIKRYQHAWQNQQFAIHSVDDAIINQAQHAQVKWHLGLIRPFIISRLKTQGVTFYSLDYRVINPAYVAYLHNHHVKVYAWTVDNPTTARRMVALGVDGIITDDTSLVRAKISNVNDGIKYQAQNFLLQLI